MTGIGTKQKLTELVNRKIERQAELRVIKRDLEELDATLLGSRFGRFFGSTYWFIKRWMTLLLGLLFVFVGLYMCLLPEEFFSESNPEFENIYSQYEAEMLEEAGEEITDFANQVINMEQPSYDGVIDIMDNMTRSQIVAKIHSDIEYWGVIVLLFAFFLLYISRQAKKVKARNSALSDTEKATQDLALAFQQVIDNEEEELQQLKHLSASI